MRRVGECSDVREESCSSPKLSDLPGASTCACFRAYSTLARAIRKCRATKLKEDIILTITSKNVHVMLDFCGQSAEVCMSREACFAGSISAV